MITKTCKTCSRQFQTAYDEINYCSNECFFDALAEDEAACEECMDLRRDLGYEDWDFCGFQWNRAKCPRC